MSYEPQVPVMSSYQPPPPPPPSATSPVKGKRRKGLLITGLIVLFGGLIGGALVVAKGQSNYQDAVHALARAPVGCTTTLVFDKADKFIVYIETEGELGELSGDCKTNGSTYLHKGDKLPKVSLTMINSAGDEVDMPQATGASYHVNGYVGTQNRSLDITTAGTYRLDVQSDDKDFAISIGKNPKDDNETWTVIGGAIALAGLIIGALLIILGLRRRQPAPAIVDPRNPIGPLPGWSPTPYPTTMPPAPPTLGGPTPRPPPPPPTTQFPGQPPIRLPDQPAAGGFAPPPFVPPPPPGGPAPAGPPLAAPPADDADDESKRWTIQEKPTEKEGWS